MVIKNVFIELLEYFTKRFAEKMGRAPQTPSELMSIQNDAVRHLNKTKGNPKKLTPQSMINERYRAANPFIGFKPTVVQGGKSKTPMEGIEKINKQLTKALNEKKAMFPGSEDKTLLRDSPEAIAKMKADNEAAVKRLKKKKEEEELFKDFRPPKDPEFASGGLARVGMAGGGRILKWLLSLGSKKPKSMFEIEELAKKQNIIKKDEVIIKQEGRDSKTGKDIIEYDVYKKSDKKRPPTEEELDDKYGELWNDEQSPWDFGSTIDELDSALAEQKAYEADMFQQYKRGELEKYVKPEVLEESRLLRQKKIDKVLDKAYDEIAGGSGFSDDYKMAADELSDSIAEQLGKGEFSDLSQMYQTDIYNTALKRVTGDLKKRLSQPKKTLEGLESKGTIDISDPEVADEFSRFMKESDPEGYKKLEQQIQLESFDVKGRKKNAYGGRAGSGLNYLLGEDDQNVRMPSGGLPGLLGE